MSLDGPVCQHGHNLFNPQRCEPCAEGDRMGNPCNSGADLPQHNKKPTTEGVRMNPLDVGKMDSVFDPKELKPQVVIESPFSGPTPADIEENKRYGRMALHDSIMRGEAPLASHLLYTQPFVLDDNLPEERELGMSLGWHVMRRSSYVAVYADRGFSSGMVRGIEAAIKAGKKIKLRFITDGGMAVVHNTAPIVHLLRHMEVED